MMTNDHTPSGSLDPNTVKISDHLVRLVQVVFALVLAQSLFLLKDVVTDPFQPGNRVAALAMVAVFVTTVMSWVDWHTTMVLSPYETRRRAEKLRLAADLLIVVVYAHLLFTIEALVGQPDSSLLPHLWGYPIVFLGYIASGVTRRLRYGPAASRLWPIVLFFFVYAAILLLYSVLWSRNDIRSSAWLGNVNFATLLTVLVAMITYRLYRGYYRDKQKRVKAAGGVCVGIDIDGVLADQITGVLPRVKKRHGIDLTYADITDWRLPIGSSDIAQEIELAHRERPYILGMKTHPGARDLLRFLYQSNRVLVITARREETLEWTRDWLNRRWLLFDDVTSSAEAKKSGGGTDVLIDDYLGNVLEFLHKTSGVAILVSQPWNQDRSTLKEYDEAGRVFVVTTLSDIVTLWPEVSNALSRGLRSAG